MIDHPELAKLEKNGTPLFWGVSLFLLAWGLTYSWLTLFAFVLADASDWASMVEEGRILPEYRDYIARIPSWVVALTAMAAITRLFGAIALLVRKTWAVAIYAVSLMCVAVIMFRGFVLADVASVIRASQIGVEALFMALSIFAVGFSYWAKSNGILR